MTPEVFGERPISVVHDLAKKGVQATIQFRRQWPLVCAGQRGKMIEHHAAVFGGVGETL